MNFGKNKSDTIIEQEPTYFLAPNFTTRPFPDGPYELGAVVEDIKHFLPLNEGDDRVPIENRYSDVKEGVTTSVNKSLSGEIGILARIVGWCVGGGARLKGRRSDDNVYHIQKLETVYFFPKQKYLSDCARLPDVQDYLKGDYTQPVYLIVGLKIAWGATIKMARGREIGADAKTDVTAPGVTFGPNIAIDRTSAMSTEHTKPANFVLGIRVMKLYQSEKEPILKGKLESRGAVLVDDDDVEESEDENRFYIADLDDEDMQGMEREVETGVDGKDVVWIIPPDTV